MFKKSLYLVAMLALVLFAGCSQITVEQQEVASSDELANANEQMTPDLADETKLVKRADKVDVSVSENTELVSQPVNSFNQAKFLNQGIEVEFIRDNLKLVLPDNDNLWSAPTEPSDDYNGTRRYIIFNKYSQTNHQAIELWIRPESKLNSFDGKQPNVKIGEAGIDGLYEEFIDEEWPDVLNIALSFNYEGRFYRFSFSRNQKISGIQSVFNDVRSILKSIQLFDSSDLENYSIKELGLQFSAPKYLALSYQECGEVPYFSCGFLEKSGGSIFFRDIQKPFDSEHIGDWQYSMYEGDPAKLEQFGNNTFYSYGFGDGPFSSQYFIFPQPGNKHYFVIIFTDSGTRLDSPVKLNKSQILSSLSVEN